jgi:hypothetical protein
VYKNGILDHIVLYMRIDAVDRYQSAPVNNQDRLDRAIIPEGLEDPGSCHRWDDGGWAAPISGRDSGRKQPDARPYSMMVSAPSDDRVARDLPRFVEHRRGLDQMVDEDRCRNEGNPRIGANLRSLACARDSIWRTRSLVIPSA